MPTGATLDSLRAGWHNPPPDSRPMMRWWWFGPNVDRDELDRELGAMAAAGIGGVEVSYVYPLGSESPELLSATFCGQLRFAAERARQLGLRFDLTLGSGWSFGGPHITTDLAAKKLHWDRREISAPAVDIPITTGWPGDQFVAAFLAPGSVGERADFVPVELDAGVLRIPAGSGPRQLITAGVRPTGQVVKRAAAGADGPVLDHYSAAAARAHIEHLAEPLLRAVPAELIGSVFCDSLEVYGANWTPAIVDEFAHRRGYPLLPRLYQLIIDTYGCEQLRIDYYRTLTELYEENFVSIFQDWAAGHGVPFRIQGYGTPPASISSYRFADLYEGEGFGWKELTQTRWASSAAHHYGLPVVSSETWTWVHSPSFRATPLDLKGEAHEHLLAGINQIIGHGWPYSPEVTEGLGWYFYAAGALDDRNPWWPAMPALMAYLQRLCWLMRQGEPAADVLIYVPCDDIYPRLGHEVGGSLDLWKEARTHIDPAIPATVRDNGWNFDLVDDAALSAVKPAAVPVIILPSARRIPEPTQAWLADHRTAGGAVITVDHDVTTLRDDIAAAVAPELQIFPATGDIGSVRRRIDDADVHLVINTGPHPRRIHADPRQARTGYEVWHADTGTITSAGELRGPIAVDLAPYQAAVIVLHDSAVAHPEAGTPTLTPAGPALELRDWSVRFGPESFEEAAGRVTLPHRWEDDPARANFSGTINYLTTVELDQSFTAAGRMMIDFGESTPVDAGSSERDGVRGNSYRVQVTTPVREVVQVIVNGTQAGVLWAPPYALDLTDLLHPGGNTIELVVSNTAANALAADAAIDRLVQQSRDSYGHRFVMQDLDRAMDSVSSGLLGVPVLRRA
ncbi:glycosyl hydrolase [Microlunatus sp. Gsoil 973]|uniref:glycosyl hydrolase n=1 Tax=Microlunatus sp. Gsoil 973 TaxID=2672569 RepID=UPI0012B47759|nr:glycosyl hydrolase [Microlunatus sp. Gsoil 973]QGN32678.1 hypothetical protein GJV80_07505 [Microlunatus sp. Gsoil 973]